jgi:hypothetical protein
MQANRFVAAAVLFLAACTPEEKAAEKGPDEVASTPSTPAPAPAATAPPRAAPAPKTVEGDSIPAAFHGVYDVSREACGRPGDGRLAVSARELRFHESVGTVRSVSPTQSGAMRVAADYQGEGQSWRSSRDLSLSGDGSKLTVSGEGTSMVRTRCPDGAR